MAQPSLDAHSLVSVSQGLESEACPTTPTNEVPCILNHIHPGFPLTSFQEAACHCIQGPFLQSPSRLTAVHRETATPVTLVA